MPPTVTTSTATTAQGIRAAHGVLLGLAHVHHHQHAQVVVRRDDAIQRQQDGQPHQLRCQRSVEDIEFAEESGRHRQAQQGKQEQRKTRGKKRLARPQPGQVVDLDVTLGNAAQLRDDDERAQLHQCVGEQVIHRRRSAQRQIVGSRRGGQRDQNVSGVGDRTIRQHALDVGLHQRRQISRDHRQRRGNP